MCVDIVQYREIFLCQLVHLKRQQTKNAQEMHSMKQTTGGRKGGVMQKMNVF